jgi:hypothetical protein
MRIHLEHHICSTFASIKRAKYFNCSGTILAESKFAGRLSRLVRRECRFYLDRRIGGWIVLLFGPLQRSGVFVFYGASPVKITLVLLIFAPSTAGVETEL